MKQDDLYKLVQGLSKQEKIFFNRFAQIANSRKNKHYITLFKTIEQQLKKQGYVDETQLKEQFQYLSVEKRYLMNALIRALTVFHDKQEGTIEVRTLIKQIELLMDRRIFNEAQKLHTKAVAIAKHYDLHEDLIILNNLQMSLIDYQGQNNELSRMERFFLDKNKRMAASKNYDEYRLFIYKMNTWGKESGYIDDEKKAEKFKKLIDTPLLNANYPQSRKAKELYFKVRLAVLDLQYDLVGRYEEFQKRIQFMRANIHLYIPFNQLIFTHNYIRCCVNVQCFKEASKELDYLEELIAAYPLKTGMITSMIYMRRLDLYSRMGTFEENRKWIERAEYGLANDQEFGAFQRETLYFYLGRAYLELGNPERALDYLQQVGDYKVYNKVSVNYAAATVLIMICYYELEWYSNLESALISFYRQVRRAEIKYKVYESIIKYFKLGIANKDITNRRTLQFFYSEWESIAPYSRESIPFQFFHYKEWLRSKIEQKSLAAYFPSLEDQLR